MKISEAKQTYRNYIQSYQEQQMQLSRQRQDLQKKMDSTTNGAVIYAKEAAVLDLSMEALNKQQEQYQKYLDTVNQQFSAYEQLYASQQAAENAKDACIDMGKVMEVARRLMKGAIVPPQDEKKLIEYSFELYQAAKNIGAMMREKEKEEYDSLWKDEEKEGQPEAPSELAGDTEVAAGPSFVEPAQVIAAVSS